MPRSDDQFEPLSWRRNGFDAPSMGAEYRAYGRQPQAKPRLSARAAGAVERFEDSLYLFLSHSHSAVLERYHNIPSFLGGMEMDCISLPGVAQGIVKQVV